MLTHNSAQTDQPKLCPCGRPLHYRSELVRSFVERAIREHGEFVTVNAFGRRWLVSRHFIALHGIVASDLLHLGFRELPPE